MMKNQKPSIRTSRVPEGIGKGPPTQRGEALGRAGVVSADASGPIAIDGDLLPSTTQIPFGSTSHRQDSTVATCTGRLDTSKPGLENIIEESSHRAKQVKEGFKKIVDLSLLPSEEFPTAKRHLDQYCEGERKLRRACVAGLSTRFHEVGTDRQIFKALDEAENLYHQFRKFLLRYIPG